MSLESGGLPNGFSLKRRGAAGMRNGSFLFGSRTWRDSGKRISRNRKRQRLTLRRSISVGVRRMVRNSFVTGQRYPAHSRKQKKKLIIKMYQWKNVSSYQAYLNGASCRWFLWEETSECSAVTLISSMVNRLQYWRPSWCHVWITPEISMKIHIMI